MHPLPSQGAGKGEGKLPQELGVGVGWMGRWEVNLNMNGKLRMCVRGTLVGIK